MRCALHSAGDARTQAAHTRCTRTATCRSVLHTRSTDNTCIASGCAHPPSAPQVTFEFKPTFAGQFLEQLTIRNVLDFSNKCVIMIKAYIQRPENFWLKNLSLDFGAVSAQLLAALCCAAGAAARYTFLWSLSQFVIFVSSPSSYCCFRSLVFLLPGFRVLRPCDVCSRARPPPRPSAALRCAAQVLINEKSRSQRVVLKNISQKLRQFEIVRASAFTHTHYSVGGETKATDVNPPASFDPLVWFKLEDVSLQPVLSAVLRDEQIDALERKLRINLRKEKMEKASHDANRTRCLLRPCACRAVGAATTVLCLVVSCACTVFWPAAASST